jgi:hypothetical protein
MIEEDRAFAAYLGGAAYADEMSCFLFIANNDGAKVP